jgi:glycosyltransferase involved in cell wall biosynthesis
MFRADEKPWARLRRILHFPIQRFNRVFFRGITRANLILTAGGERTRTSLLAAGCKPEILADSLDCGIADELLARPRIVHKGSNPRFVHFGRLVFHKCTFLIIESLMKTKHPIQLDVIGSGPELANCKALATRLGLDDRVTFRPSYTRQSDLFDALGQYRALVLPSIEDANGMVVQEAMALGLPSICLDWGGPQLLVENERTGYLVRPEEREQVTREMAACMDRLAEDGALAESFSIAGRERAESWRWSRTARDWLALFDRIAPPRPTRRKDTETVGAG